MRASGNYTAGKFKVDEVVFTFDNELKVRQKKIIEIQDTTGLYRLDDHEQVGEDYIGKDRPELDLKMWAYYKRLEVLG